MNTSLYLGKSYLTGDGDNTISQFSYNYSDADTKYLGDVISMLILIPFSMSKSAIEYNQVNRPSYLYSFYANSRISNAPNTKGAYARIKFAVNSITLNRDSVEPLFMPSGSMDLHDYMYYVGIGSIVKYYDVEKGIWVVETINRKEIKTTYADNGHQGATSEPWEVIIGTKLKPNLLKLNYTSGTDVQCDIDLKTGNENNVNLE